jgi:predicted nucleotidyltransferase
MITNEIINSVTQKLVAAYNPITIYLFGSYAWGTPDDESDLDLLIVVEKSDQKPHRRGDAAFDALWGLEISKDLLVYTRDEFEQRAKDVTTLCYKVAKDGRKLYARA